MPPRVLPHRKWFLPDAYHDWRFRRAVDRAVEEARDVLHVADDDLDGAGADVMLRLSRGGEAVSTFYTTPYDFVDVLERVVEHDGGGRTVAISDLSPGADELEAVADLVRGLEGAGWRVEWRDHHHEQWPDEGRKAVERAGAHLTLDESGERCTADLVREDEGLDDAFAVRLAELVRDHDLWLQEDPRSEVLNDACAEMGPAELVERLLETRDLDDPAYDAVHAASEEEREEDARWSLERAQYHEGDRARVGVTYGSGPTNTTLHRMQEREDADLGIMLRPEGSFSLRSRDGVDVCHEIAQAFGGGGHPNASGGTLDLASWEMARYWLLRGDDPEARELIREAVRRVDEHLAGT